MCGGDSLVVLHSDFMRPREPSRPGGVVLVAASPCPASAACTQGPDGLALVELVSTGTPEEVAAAAADLPDTALARARHGDRFDSAHAAIVDAAHPEVSWVPAAEEVDIDLLDVRRRTPLHHAIDGNDARAAGMLPEASASPTAAGEASYSPRASARLCRGTSPRTRPA